MRKIALAAAVLGTMVTIALAPNVGVATLVKKTLSDIKTGDVIASTTPIFANAPGDTSLVNPGAAVFVIALKQDDGKLTSARLYAEKDGVKPPM